MTRRWASRHSSGCRTPAGGSGAGSGGSNGCRPRRQPTLERAGRESPRCGPFGGPAAAAVSGADVARADRAANRRTGAVSQTCGPSGGPRLARAEVTMAEAVVPAGESLGARLTQIRISQGRSQLRVAELLCAASGTAHGHPARDLPVGAGAAGAQPRTGCAGWPSSWRCRSPSWNGPPRSPGRRGPASRPRPGPGGPRPAPATPAGAGLDAPAGTAFEHPAGGGGAAGGGAPPSCAGSTILIGGAGLRRPVNAALRAEAAAVRADPTPAPPGRAGRSRAARRLGQRRRRRRAAPRGRRTGSV